MRTLPIRLGAPLLALGLGVTALTAWPTARPAEARGVLVAARHPDRGIPRTASARRVVRAYLAAINRHDEAAGRRLSTRRFAEGVAATGTDNPFRNWKKVTKIRISKPTRDSNYTSIDGTRYRYARNVMVTFNLRQREEISFLDGPHVWGYTLVRQSPEKRWRIDGAGTG